MWRWHDTCDFEDATQATNTHTGEPEGEADWTSPTVTADVPCSIQPRTSIEGEGGAVVVSGWLGVFPGSSVPLHTTRIRWRGRLLQIDGDTPPLVFDAAVHHLEVPLKAWSAA